MTTAALSETHPPRRGLAARFGAVFLVFVVTGSLLLLAWFDHQERAQSARVFVALAKADVDFIRELKLPRSEKLAGDLGRLLKMEVYFRSRDGQTMPPAAIPLPSSSSNRAVKFDNRREALAMNLDDTHDVIFIRDAAAVASITQPGTLGALGAFWLLSLALAWAVARDVVKPLSSLTRRLPTLFTDAKPEVPEANRSDEIGQLATALVDARTRLNQERLLREQSEKLALLGRVATGLAHEIKNPVSSIQLHAQLVDSGTLDSDARKSLELIQGEARVIDGLVNQWLYVARPAPPGTSPLDAREVLQHVIDTIRAQADHASVQIATTLDSPLPIRGDRQRLSQAFRNLAINAIQAMPTGGTLTISGKKDDNSIVITFTDTGPGFSAAALAKAADLFFSEREGGLGIGLNVVREVVTHHEGQLEIANAQAKGARVTITLPASIP